MAASIEPLASGEIKRAKKRATEFVRKFIPSALEAAIDVEFRAHSRLDNLATLYGRWWHKLLERLDWRGGIDSAQKLFEKQLSICPDPKSAMKDWKAMRANLFSNDRFTPYLKKDETRFHRELPFSWQINERIVLEGFIDALMIDGDAGRCLLVDWKTNRINKGDEADLRKRYQPQIAAYWKAVREITKLEVEAGIFATATGHLVAYETEELEAEWTRLQTLPPDRLIDEVSAL